jgi:hypothetical protein
MSTDYGPGIVPAQVASVGRRVAESTGLAFRDACDESMLQDATARFFPDYRDRVFSP